MSSAYRAALRSWVIGTIHFVHYTLTLHPLFISSLYHDRLYYGHFSSPPLPCHAMPCHALNKDPIASPRPTLCDASR